MTGRSPDVNEQPRSEDGVSGQVWPLVQGASILLVLAAFLWTALPVLNPFFLFLLLAALLVPFRAWPGHSLVLTAAGIVTGLWLLSTTGGLLAPFILALGLAYVLDPVTDLVQARVGGRRGPAILILALPVVGVAVIVIAFGVPALATQAAEVIERTPVLVERLAALVITLEERLRETLPEVGDALVRRIEQLDSEAVVNFLEERRAQLAERAWGGVLGLGRGLGAAATILGYVVITPVLTFYLLRDWDTMVSRIQELLPARHRESVTRLAREYDHLLARFLRGQFLVALSVGTITAVGFLITGFPYAFLMGVLVAVFGVIPYLGLILSLIPAIAIALVSGNVLLSLVKVAGVFGVAQGLEGTVLSPRIVGESVGLHPVWVVLALSVGGFYFGFTGLLLGVPGAVGVKLLVIRGLARYRDSRFYRNGSEAEA